jgi:hypothetical protein
MATTVSVRFENDRAVLQAPYHPQAPAQFRARGGRWDAAKKVWVFDARDTQAVAEICQRVYGVNPLAPATPTCTLRVRMANMNMAMWARIDKPEVWLVGRRICWRPTRDAQVLLGEGVVLVEGHFRSSGGSMRHPAVGEVAGVVLEVRDVPQALAEEAVAEHPNAVEIVQETVPPDPFAAIEAQLDQLLAQLPAERRAAWLARQA